MAIQFKKRLSLIATIIIILIAAVGGYYLINLKKGPYPVSSFVSLSYKWGIGDSLVNSYNSATGDFQYLNNNDSLVKSNLKLHANHIIYIHSKANELKFWELPDTIANPNADLNSDKVLRYEIIFNYLEKSKKVIYLTDYNENPVVKASITDLQNIISKTLEEIEERYAKP